MRRRRSSSVKRGNNTTTVTIAHVEYITDIFPSSAFTMQIDQAVNPGLPFLFPWLHKLAAMFETYNIIKLIFFFKSTSADAILSAGTSTALGSLIMMAQYNVLLPPPSNKREMLNNATAKSCKPSNSMAFVINPNASYKTLFVRTPTTSDEGDRRLYDQCDFHLATEGMQGTSGSIGELSVMAVMKFKKPTLQNIGIPADVFSWNLPYTPAGGLGGGNYFFRLSFDNNGNYDNTLLPVAGSNAGGRLKLDPADNYWKYMFGEVADAVIGSVFEVTLDAQIGFDAPLPASMRPVFYGANSNDGPGGPWGFFNCRQTTFLGQRGTTACFASDPIAIDTPPNPQLNTLAYSGLRAPVKTYTDLTVYVDNQGFKTNFFVEITGPNANFFQVGVIPYSLMVRWFDNDMPGTPSGTFPANNVLHRNFTVKQVALP